MAQVSKKTAHHTAFEVAPNVWGVKDIFVNVFFIRNSADNSWVLVDAGLKTSYFKIQKAVNELFDGAAPSAIILTHGILTM